MRCKQFEIRPLSPPVYGERKDCNPYRYELVKWQDGGHCFVIGYLDWDREGFEFRSCGTRYLQHRENGLEKWLLAWCTFMTEQIHFEQEEED